MIEVAPGLTLDERTFDFRFVRASGPGGQHVNKVSTAVELRFDAAAHPDIGPAMYLRLRTLAGRRMDGSGVILIESQKGRSQLMNKEDAVARLVELLRQAAVVPKRRRPTKPTKGSKERRLTAKKTRGNIKQGRQSRPHDD